MCSENIWMLLVDFCCALRFKDSSSNWWSCSSGLYFKGQEIYQAMHSLTEGYNHGTPSESWYLSCVPTTIRVRHKALVEVDLGTGPLARHAQHFQKCFALHRHPQVPGGLALRGRLPEVREAPVLVRVTWTPASQCPCQAAALTDMTNTPMTKPHGQIRATRNTAGEWLDLPSECWNNLTNIC